MATPDSTETPNALLGPHDPSPVIVRKTGAGSPILFIGDHAGRQIPRALGALGLSSADLDRHIAWDIGVSALGGLLAETFEATFVEQAYSRLVIDCNRRPGSADSIPPLSDGTAVPGNLRLSSEQASARLREVFHPYHEAIRRELDAHRSAGPRTILVSLHSFTPSMQGTRRPWRFGILHAGDSAFSLSMLALMSAALGEGVGDNQPYALDSKDYTVPAHAKGRGVDYLELEVRQDLIGDDAGRRAIAREVAGYLREALSSTLSLPEPANWAPAAR